MKVGLIGLPTVGKTTFFNLLTNQRLETRTFQSGKIEAHIGLASVPDERIDFLSGIYRPKKTTYAQIEVIDVPGLVAGASKGKGSGNQFLQDVRQVDCLVHIVRAFKDENILHADGSIDVLRDIKNINAELLLADLQLVESRIERIEAAKKISKDQAEERSVLEAMLAHFEVEGDFVGLALSAEQAEAVDHLDFLTAKPLIIVVNMDDTQLVESFEGWNDIVAYCQENEYPVFRISAQTEMEISELDPEDREEFMKELHIRQSGVDALAKTVYGRLQLLSFMTVGDDEVRAWTIKAGTNARSAAGKIHSDLERGFIRAEVTSFVDFQEAGSMARARELGKLRLEGKDYIVQDGDIMTVRFNV